MQKGNKLIRRFWTGVFECNDCKRELKHGDFVAVIGHIPALVMGRSDAILKATGEIYCDACFNKRCLKQSTDH